MACGLSAMMVGCEPPKSATKPAVKAGAGSTTGGGAEVPPAAPAAPAGTPEKPAEPAPKADAPKADAPAEAPKTDEAPKN